MLGFSDFFRRGKGNFNEKAYFIDNVYDSRESIKVFVESILNIAVQSVFFYLGGSINPSFSLQNITANEGLGISAVKYFVLSMVLNFVTIIKKCLVIQLLARFNKLHACKYLNEQFNDLGGRDVLNDAGKEAILDRKTDKRSVDTDG